MQDDKKYLLDSALKFLGYRPRSRKEITDYLNKKTDNENQISQILDQLDKLKLINDEEFTAWLVKSRSRNRGSIFIKQDLKKYGIEAKDLKTNDLEIAINLLNKKKPQDYNQAYRYLAYRGIPSSVIAHAIKSVYNKENVN